MPLVTFDDRVVDFEIETGTNTLQVGNVLIQWGYSVPSTSGDTSVTFTKSYADSPRVYMQVQSSRGTDVRSPQVSSISTTGFTFFVSGRNSSQNYYSGAGTAWLAIGTVDN